MGFFTDSTGTEVPRVWSKPFYTFDNFIEAMLSLFVVATLDGYSPMMEAAISVPLTKGLQPQPNSAPVNALFFVAFIVVTVFVMLNLFVGVPLNCRATAYSTPCKGFAYSACVCYLNPEAAGHYRCSLYRLQRSHSRLGA